MNRWIEYNEKSPPKNGYYLVSNSDNEVSLDFIFNGKWRDGDRYNDKIIAYMPLPKPYRRENMNRVTDEDGNVIVKLNDKQAGLVVKALETYCYTTSHVLSYDEEVAQDILEQSILEQIIYDEVFD